MLAEGVGVGRLNSANVPMSVRKHSVLTTSCSVAPASARRSATLAIVCTVWAVTPPSTMAPSFMPPCPDTMTKSPARTNGLYGPSGLLMRRKLDE